jgi:hypothetical protein
VRELAYEPSHSRDTLFATAFATSESSGNDSTMPPAASVSVVNERLLAERLGLLAAAIPGDLAVPHLRGAAVDAACTVPK